MTKPLNASCLCGAVRFSAVPQKMQMSACHCQMCRKWSGGTFLAVGVNDLEFNDQAHVKVFRSSDWGERVFCGQCGSTLVWRMQKGGHAAVSVQAFDNPEEFEFAEQIFIDKKPANYAFANKTHEMTEAEVIAAFTSGESA